MRRKNRLLRRRGLRQPCWRRKRSIPFRFRNRRIERGRSGPFRGGAASPPGHHKECYIVHLPVTVSGLDAPLSGAFVVTKDDALRQVYWILALLIGIIGIGILIILRRALRPIGMVISATEQMERPASFVKISEQAEENMRHVESASQLVDEANQSFNLGISYMKRLEESMKEIDNASSRIGMITKVIEDIASQTNILGLNAAIAAARALP